MSDLIDRQAAIDALDLITWYHQNMDGEMVEGANSEHQAWYKAEDVYKVLHDLPSVQSERKPEWIPVADRLPEASGKYLVTVRNGNVYAGAFSAYTGRFQCAAVAWMPLPEPYQEEPT